jgi:hypothetical protein
MKFKVLFGIACVLFIPTMLLGQINFKNDPKFTYFVDSLLLNVGIHHPNFNEIDFEFRYWMRDLSRINAHQLAIIQKSKKGGWKFKRYQLCFNDSRYQLVDSNSGDLPGWETTWEELEKQKILTMKNQPAVQSKWKSSAGEYVVIADGTLYGFELITQKRKRRYFYSNPHENLKNYDINNSELVRIDRIITLLEKRLNLNSNIKRCLP